MNNVAYITEQQLQRLCRVLFFSLPSLPHFHSFRVELDLVSSVCAYSSSFLNLDHSCDDLSWSAGGYRLSLLLGFLPSRSMVSHSRSVLPKRSQNLLSSGCWPAYVKRYPNPLSKVLKPFPPEQGGRRGAMYRYICRCIYDSPRCCWSM